MVVVVIICILPNHLDIDMYWLISLWNIFYNNVVHNCVRIKVTLSLSTPVNWDSYHTPVQVLVICCVHQTIPGIKLHQIHVLL